MSYEDTVARIPNLDSRLEFVLRSQDESGPGSEVMAEFYEMLNVVPNQLLATVCASLGGSDDFQSDLAALRRVRNNYRSQCMPRGSNCRCEPQVLRKALRELSAVLLSAYIDAAVDSIEHFLQI